MRHSSAIAELCANLHHISVYTARSANTVWLTRLDRVSLCASKFEEAPMSSVTPGTGTGAAHVAAPKAVQNPLTLIMTIKSPEDAKALKALLAQIQGAPPDKNPIWVALEKLKTVHFARFVFLANDTQLAVITTYDGSFEDYINEFIDSIGDVFNALLAHMKDGSPIPVQKNRQAFLDYVRKNDLRAIEPFYSAYPKATVLDIHAALEQA
jgi:hypothetical protein